MSLQKVKVNLRKWISICIEYNKIIEEKKKSIKFIVKKKKKKLLGHLFIGWRAKGLFKLIKDDCTKVTEKPLLFNNNKVQSKTKPKK